MIVRNRSEMLEVVKVFKDACETRLNKPFSWEFFKEALARYKQKRLESLVDKYFGHLSDADALHLVDISEGREVPQPPPPPPVVEVKKGGKKKAS